MAELLIHNSNPAGLYTADCVYRALSAFLGVSWREALNGLISWSADRGVVKFTYITTLKAYMESLGYKEVKIREKGITVNNFCERYAQKNKIYVLNCPKPSRHWTVVKWASWSDSAYVIDSFDSRHFIVDRYWERII